MTDWLREFPQAPLPDSWALNDLFLKKLEETEALWRQEGYALQLGMELEFSLRESNAFEKRVFKKGKRKRPLREAEVSSLRGNGPYKETLTEVRRFLKTEDGQAMLKRAGCPLPEAHANLRRFAAGLKSDDPGIVCEARENIFLAYLHTRTFEEGGVLDLVEPRFGDKRYGLGWFDVVGPEIRTTILGSALNVITTYHKYLSNLHKAAKIFGLQAKATDPQFHLSILRVADGKNMMVMDDEDSRTFCTSALAGYYNAMKATSFMVFDFQTLTDPFNFNAGISRLHYIRMEADNWEFRRSQTVERAHPARTLAIVLMGMADTCLHHRLVSDAPKISGYHRHPVVKDPANPLSGLSAALEHATIGDDGYLKPDKEAITAVIWRLIEAVGEKNAGRYVVHPPHADHIHYTLTHPYAWCRLIADIRMTPDNKLDLSTLDNTPKIKAAFERLDVRGQRNSLSIEDHRIGTEPHVLGEAIQAFHASTFGRDHFSADERSQITAIYQGMPDKIRNQAGTDLIKAFKSGIASTRRHFSGVVKALPETVQIDIAALFLSGRLYTHFVFWPALQVDGCDAHVQKIKDIVQNRKIVPRFHFMTKPSYFHYLRSAFQSAIDGEIENLTRKPTPRRESLALGFQACGNIFKEQIGDRLSSQIHHIQTVAKKIVNLEIFHEHGADPTFIDHTIKEAADDLYGFFVMALQNRSYTDADIASDIAELKANAREFFVACEELMEKAPERQLTIHALRTYKEAVMKNLESMDIWCHDNLDDQDKIGYAPAKATAEIMQPS